MSRVNKNWLYRLGRLIPEHMIDELLALDDETLIVERIQPLPMGRMPQYEAAQKEYADSLKPKKKAPAKKKAAKKDK